MKWNKRIGSGLTAALVGVLAATATASAAPITPVRLPIESISASSPLAGVTQCSANDFEDDVRLGPAQVPVVGVVGIQLWGWHRTGGMPEDAFLETFAKPDSSKTKVDWNYPPHDGYVVDPVTGEPQKSVKRLDTGSLIDRYGQPGGGFLSPQGLSYPSRAIPPSNLDSAPAAGCNYHEYQVVKSFEVEQGPIAAWFAQPGGGTQYELDSTLLGLPVDPPLSVEYLVDNQYLKDVTPADPFGSS